MLSSLVTAFRQQYPKGSLVSELTHFQEGQYVVRVMVRVDDLALATALAADSTLEAAEDRAIERALRRLALPGVGGATTAGLDLPLGMRPPVARLVTVLKKSLRRLLKKPLRKP